MTSKRITNRMWSIMIPVVLVTGAVLLVSRGTAPAAPPLPDPAAMAALGTERRTNDEIVSLWERKVTDNPESPTFLAALASAQLTAAGDAGDLAGYEVAERTARRGLALDLGNARARLALAAALSGQHEFAAAAELTQEVLVNDPSSAAALLALGDARLELGDEIAARAAYERVATDIGAVPAVRSRLARVESIDGDPNVARDLARQALIEAGQLDLRPADAAFYWFQLANYEFAVGDVADAERTLRSALVVDPGNLGATELLGRVLAALGHDDEAIDVYEGLIERGPAADLHGELAKLYQRSGRPDVAASQITAGLEVAAATADRFPAERRHLIGFLADHDPAEALRLARIDLAEREDIHSHEWYAWSLLQTGDVEAAVEAIGPALELGTQDALLLYHAGAIHAAAGHAERARHLLEAALDINPVFDIDHAQRAREMLDELP